MEPGSRSHTTRLYFSSNLPAAFALAPSPLS
jgi:hypothetical protein